MPGRVFSSDLPGRASLARRAIVRARIDAANYILDLGDGTPQLGYWSGGITINRGQHVTAYWANEAAVYVIRGLASGEEPASALAQQSGTQTPVTGGNAA